MVEGIFLDKGELCSLGTRVPPEELLWLALCHKKMMMEAHSPFKTHLKDSIWKGLSVWAFGHTRLLYLSLKPTWTSKPYMFRFQTMISYILDIKQG